MKEKVKIILFSKLMASSQAAFDTGFGLEDNLTEAWISSGIRWASGGTVDVILGCLWI